MLVNVKVPIYGGTRFFLALGRLGPLSNRGADSSPLARHTAHATGPFKLPLMRVQFPHLIARGGWKGPTLLLHAQPSSTSRLSFFFLNLLYR